MNESRYVDALENLLRSTFAHREQIKCVQTSETTFEFVACPLKLMEHLPNGHPFHSIFLETLENFHRKYRGASTKTLVFFFVRLYRSLAPLVDRTTRKEMFDGLTELLDEAFRTAEKDLFEKVEEKLSPEFCLGVCRSTTIFGDCLREMREPVVEHLVRVGSAEEKCRFVPSLLLAGSTTLAEGTFRTVCLDGHLIEDFQHLGFNKTRSTKLRTIDARTNWLKLIEELLETNRIELIVASGTIDARLKARPNFRFVENVSLRIVRGVGRRTPLVYLTDLDAADDVFPLEIRRCAADSSLLQIERGATILHDVPTPHLVELRRDQLEHCLGRLDEIRRTNVFLRGSGKFEDDLARLLPPANDSPVRQCFLQCLRDFRADLQSNVDIYQEECVDDYPSKFDAWRTAVHLLKLFLSIGSTTATDF